LALQKIISPLTRLSKTEAFSGFFLIGSFVAAIVWSNISPSGYNQFWQQTISIGFNNNLIQKPLLIWINDGLMAFFFFVVGLEIKKEVLYGELKTWRKALLPIIGAVGGMVLPAILYFAFNPESPDSSGWGIPMATDIAFSLGILSLLGTRIPKSGKIFLIALAIVDDLGAVLVIAFFYSSDISFASLGLGLICAGIMALANFLGVRNTVFYGVIGIGGVWFAFLLSGVHPTIAGILAAITIPANRTVSPSRFNTLLIQLSSKFKSNNSKHFNNQIVQSIKSSFEGVEPPLQKLEYRFAPWVNYLVLPLFALANSGLVFDQSMQSAIFSPISTGILIGLLLGKPLGICGLILLFKKFNWVEFPKSVNLKLIFGISLLAGIGFTMSLFISGLAFERESALIASKVGIFTASIASGLLGYFFLRAQFRKK
jgi:NhaA family Na+:H+ antiporter